MALETWLRAALRTGRLLVVVVCCLSLALVGCGGGGDDSSGVMSPSPGGGGDDMGDDMGGGGGSPMPPPMSDGPGGPGGPGGPEMGMGGMPGMTGPGGGGAPAAPQGRLDIASAPPIYPSRAGDPFAPLDRPLKPIPPVNPRANVLTHPPLRPVFVMPHEEQKEKTVAQPPRLRTAGLLGGKAIVEQGDQTFTVWPGQRIEIDYNGPRQVEVVSVSGTGTTLRDVITGELYVAPYQH